MCCTCTVKPIVQETAEAILALGEFKDIGGHTWERTVRDDEGYVVTVRATVSSDTMLLILYPRITAMEHHRRVSGGVYLEIACKVAEKCGSRIVQSSNIGECIQNGDREKLLADYGAGQRLDWEAVCVGFQRAIGGIE